AGARGQRRDRRRALRRERRLRRLPAAGAALDREARLARRPLALRRHRPRDRGDARRSSADAVLLGRRRARGAGLARAAEPPHTRGLPSDMTQDLAILGGAPLRTRSFTVEPLVDAEEERLALEAIRAKSFSRYIGSKIADMDAVLRMPSVQAAEISDYWHPL